MCVCLASANGSESALVGKSLLRFFVHPLDAFRVSIHLDLFFVKTDFEVCRASVELFLDVGPLSATYSKVKIWPQNK